MKWHVEHPMLHTVMRKNADLKVAVIHSKGMN